MASLASYTTLYVTAIALDGDSELKNIVAVRWAAGGQDPEESSAADFVRWLDHGDGRAFVRRADGGRGPQVKVYFDGAERYLRSRDDEAQQQDELLLLPQWHAGRHSMKHTSRR